MATMKLPQYRNLSDAIARVRDSHLVVTEGIATSAEKHRDTMNERRNKLHQQLALKSELPHAKT